MIIAPGDVISYIEMCQAEGTSLQRGMNFRLAGRISVILMSVRRGAPYADRVEDNGRTLVYEGHDVPRSKFATDPKKLDQPEFFPSGRPTQNGLFLAAALQTARGQGLPEIARVYEKIHNGLWVFDGTFELVDGWTEAVEGRKVFRFKLRLVESATASETYSRDDLSHNRLIPSAVKLDVWKRDRGRCVLCGSRENLHFDHIIPFSLGGSSLSAKNVQLLCAKHNLQKRDNIV
jgi:HNH endonuclease